MYKKTIILFGIIFLLLFNFGYAIDNDIHLYDIPFNEIPIIWPIRGGLGAITMFFGENVHPIHGQTHFHRGIDISTFRAGDFVVATADGQVITAEYKYDYGYHIIIEHKRGFHTLYAHMQNLNVQAGQNVRQGEIIGSIGSSGMSLGPHLHYEIHVNSEPVDPLLYINISN